MAAQIVGLPGISNKDDFIIYYTEPKNALILCMAWNSFLNILKVCLKVCLLSRSMYTWWCIIQKLKNEKRRQIREEYNDGVF